MGSDRNDQEDAGEAAPVSGPRKQHSPSSPPPEGKNAETVRDAVEEERSRERRYQSVLLHRLRNAG